MDLLAIAIPFVVAFGVAYLATPVVSLLAQALEVIDRPNERKVNQRQNIPLLGGLAVALGFFVGIAIAVFFFTEGDPYRGHLEGLLVGGLGVGLAVASDLARWLGGSVELTSRTGEGTTAVLKVPSVPPGAGPADGAGDAAGAGLFGLAVQRVPAQPG